MSQGGSLAAVASPDAEHKAWGAQASVVGAPRLQSTGPVAVAQGLSCLKSSGIFLDQRLNPYLLHWQADSLSQNHQGHPEKFFFYCLILTLESSFVCVRKAKSNSWLH